MNKKSFQSFKLRKDVKKKILRNRLIFGFLLCEIVKMAVARLS